MGRIHVADGRAGVVYMFNPVGEYIASYPDPGTLDGPSDIAISRSSRLIFVADSRAKRIYVFQYGEE